LAAKDWALCCHCQCQLLYVDALVLKGNVNVDGGLPPIFLMTRWWWWSWFELSIKLGIIGVRREFDREDKWHDKVQFSFFSAETARPIALGTGEAEEMDGRVSGIRCSLVIMESTNARITMELTCGLGKRSLKTQIQMTVFIFPFNVTLPSLCDPLSGWWFFPCSLRVGFAWVDDAGGGGGACSPSVSVFGTSFHYSDDAVWLPYLKCGLHLWLNNPEIHSFVIIIDFSWEDFTFTTIREPLETVMSCQVEGMDGNVGFDIFRAFQLLWLFPWPTLSRPKSQFVH